MEQDVIKLQNDCLIQQKKDTLIQQRIIDYTPGGMHVCYLGNPIHLEYASDGLCKMLGYTRDEFERITKSNYVTHLPIEDWSLFISFVKELAQVEKIATVEYRMIKKDGSMIVVSDTMESLIAEDGVMRGYSSVTDITELKAVETQLIQQKERYKNLYQKIKISNERFRMISSFSGSMFYEYDLRESKYLSFENTENVLGYKNDQLDSYLRKISRTENRLECAPCPGMLSLLVYPEDCQAVKRAYKNLIDTGESQVEARMICQDEEYRWFSIMCRLIDGEDGKPEIQMGCIRNIDNIKKQIQYLREKSIMDSMTGLMNKVSAFELIDQILKEKPNAQHAFLFIDLDNFKSINDMLGHETGDRVIKFAANKLKGLFSEQDIVARFGGDEFIAFVIDIASKNSVINLGCKFNEMISNCEVLQGTPITLTASIGIAFSDRNPTTVKNLCLLADEETYKVKKSGKNNISCSDR